MGNHMIPDEASTNLETDYPQRVTGTQVSIYHNQGEVDSLDCIVTSWRRPHSGCPTIVIQLRKWRAIAHTIMVMPRYLFMV